MEVPCPPPGMVLASAQLQCSGLGLWWPCLGETTRPWPTGRWGALANGNAFGTAFGGPAVVQGLAGANVMWGPAQATQQAIAVSDQAALASGGASATTGNGPALAASNTGALKTGPTPGAAVATDKAFAASGNGPAAASSQSTAVNQGSGPALSQSESAATGTGSSAASSKANVSGCQRPPRAVPRRIFCQHVAAVGTPVLWPGTRLWWCQLSSKCRCQRWFFLWFRLSSTVLK